MYWGVKERRGALHLLEKIPIEKVYYFNLHCVVGPFPTGSLNEVVCANGEHTTRGYHEEGRGKA